MRNSRRFPPGQGFRPPPTDFHPPGPANQRTRGRPTARRSQQPRTGQVLSHPLRGLSDLEPFRGFHLAPLIPGTLSPPAPEHGEGDPQEIRHREPVRLDPETHTVGSVSTAWVSAPRIVGIDEYATRKGRHYGTVLVDVERRRPVDLLPDRKASSLAAWLGKHPGIEVVCRDRAPYFAEGATPGAPQAVQVADRWHLWHNLSEAAERCVADHRGCLQLLAPDPAQPARKPETIEDPSGSPWPRGHRFADRTRANHATVHELLTAGLSRRAIGRQLRMTSRTVKPFADAATPEDLFRGQWQGRPSKLDAFKPYLDDRWNQGCTNTRTVWEEIVPLGYQGSYQRVRVYFREKRTPLPTRSQLAHRHPASSSAGSSGAPRRSQRSATFDQGRSGPLHRTRRPHHSRPTLRPDAHRAPGRTAAAVAGRRPA
ncbi:transposase [Streptomyces canus]|uniref:transposase n=1 Tax=Streptomyces canus TaxID=58343 RepID=UPI003F4B0028